MERPEALKTQFELLQALDCTKHDITNLLNAIYSDARSAIAINLKEGVPVEEAVSDFFLDLKAPCSDWRSANDSEKREMITSLCQLFASPILKQHRINE